MAIKHKVNATYMGNQGDVLLLHTGFVPKIEEGKQYTVVFKDLENIRSDEQNRKMWAIIQEIALENNEDTWKIYTDGLEETGIKFVEIQIIPEAFNALAQEFRAIKVTGSIKDKDCNHMLICKCFIGSSKFNTKEMTELIDYFLFIQEEFRKV